MEIYVLTTRTLTECESMAMFDWIYLNCDYVKSVEEMTVREVKKITLLWARDSVMNGIWTISLTDDDLAVYFRLRWG